MSQKKKDTPRRSNKGRSPVPYAKPRLTKHGALDSDTIAFAYNPP